MSLERAQEALAAAQLCIGSGLRIRDQQSILRDVLGRPSCAGACGYPAFGMEPSGVASILCGRVNQKA